MGVSGAGKTTVGRRLAADLGWSFYEGDDFHPDANVRKMTAGIPLTDEDRLPWLRSLRALVERCLATGEDAVIACSALKESYRRLLAEGLDGVRFVHLTGDPRLIAERLEQRAGHFMKPGMLASQFTALEPPENAVVVDVTGSPEEITAEVRRRLSLPTAQSSASS